MSSAGSFRTETDTMAATAAHVTDVSDQIKAQLAKLAGQLDPVAGSAHFNVPEAEALHLMDALRARLPGYLVPRLVREVPGAPSKMPVGPGIGTASDAG